VINRFGGKGSAAGRDSTNIFFWLLTLHLYFISSWVCGIFGLTIILGMSWGLGFLMFSKSKTVSLIGACMFTFFNGLQVQNVSRALCFQRKSDVFNFSLHIAFRGSLFSFFMSCLTSKLVRESGKNSKKWLEQMFLPWQVAMLRDFLDSCQHCYSANFIYYDPCCGNLSSFKFKC